MENPVRTARYQAILATRRREIDAWFDDRYPQPTEIVWELGSGHGHFLAAYAHANPADLCIGIDIMSDRVERAVRKRNRALLRNLEFLHAEASLFLHVMPPRVRIKRVFILFPDPWPKARHHKHRIVRDDFLRALAERTTPECRLYFRTDYIPYFEAGRTVIGAHAAWKICEEPWPFEFETVFQSRADTHHSLVARRRST